MSSINNNIGNNTFNLSNLIKSLLNQDLTSTVLNNTLSGLKPDVWETIEQITIGGCLQGFEITDGKNTLKIEKLEFGALANPDKHLKEEGRKKHLI